MSTPRTEAETRPSTSTPESAPGYRLFDEGDPLYEDMLAAIAGARTRVWMESYIFSADRVGRRFAAALIRAARRGLDVRLHIDAAGSLFLLPARFRASLQRAGVEVREFHRWSWRDPWRYNRRNHCKLLLIDRCTVFLGGYNIHEENSRHFHGEQRWRDTHVRLDDPRMAEQAGELFDVFWTRRVPRSLRKDLPPDLFHGDSLVTNRIPRHRHALRRLFREGIRAAVSRICLTTPYFSPDRRTRRHLYEAAARGVQVDLLLPAVSDRRLLQMTARHIYQRFLARGIRVHEYRPRMLHAKTMVVDRRLATIGTANLDYRSLFHNYEINFVTDNPAICVALEELFESDLACATQVTLESLGRRSLWDRIGGYLGWRFRYWL